MRFNLQEFRGQIGSDTGLDYFVRRQGIERFVERLRQQADAACSRISFSDHSYNSR